MRTRSELHNVNNNIVRIIQHRAEVAKQREEEREARKEHREVDFFAPQSTPGNSPESTRTDLGVPVPHVRVLCGTDVEI